MVVDHFARNVGRPFSLVASTYFFRGPDSLAWEGISSGDEFSLEPVKKNSNAVIFIKPDGSGEFHRASLEDKG